LNTGRIGQVLALEWWQIIS